MKAPSVRVHAIAVLLAAVVSGCATTTSPSISSSGGAQKQVPALKISADCGVCQVRAGIPSLINEGYASAASSAGAKVQTDSQADVTIVSYSDRNDAARMIAGVFAGKDEIKVSVKYAGTVFSVEDYYRNAWLGIDHLAKKIGEMIFEKIKK